MYSGGHTCCLSTCCSISFSKKLIETKFHRFPKDRSRCAVWIEYCKPINLPTTDPDILNRNHRLCSLHFEDEMYMNVEKTRLSSKAIPTKFRNVNANIFTVETSHVDDSTQNESVVIDNPPTCSTPLSSVHHSTSFFSCTSVDTCSIDIQTPNSLTAKTPRKQVLQQQLSKALCSIKELKCGQSFQQSYEIDDIVIETRNDENPCDTRYTGSDRISNKGDKKECQQRYREWHREELKPCEAKRRQQNELFQSTKSCSDFDAFVTDEQCQRVEINSLHDEENQSMVAVDITTENTSTAVPEQLNPISSWPNLTIPRHGNTPSELQKAQNQIKEAFNTTKNVITKRTSDKEDDDEYDLFGKMLAKKIRKLPEHEREIFMYEIQGLYLSKLHNVNSSAHSDTSSTEIHQ